MVAYHILGVKASLYTNADLGLIWLNWQMSLGYIKMQKLILKILLYYEIIRN